MHWHHVPRQISRIALRPFQIIVSYVKRLFRGAAAASPENENPGVVAIEWGVDMDRMFTTNSFFGEKEKLKIKGRCKRCWGGLLARVDDSHAWTGIRCRVCGIRLEGKKAQDEYDRMMKEEAINLMNVGFGQKVIYSDGTFVLKIFPRLEDQTANEFRTRIQTKVAKGSKKHYLTRNAFPPGSPGLFFLQANILMDGVLDMFHLQDESVVEFPDMRIEEDGTLTVSVSNEGFRNDPKYSERRSAKRMGATMAEAMIAAFACELAMKAICLTCKDEAKKSHDLLDLYHDFPKRSRQRIEADFPEITSVLTAERHTFGAWRYFETNVGERGVRAMVDVNKARTLKKAARVILDEAELVGLSGVVEMNATMGLNTVGDREFRKQEINVTIKGRENPPKCDDA